MNVTVSTPVLIEAATGAQVMPNVEDERQTVGTWAAHLAVDADMRVKAPAYREIAARLLVVHP